MAQSGETEVVTVVRPLKIMAFVCGCLALILAIVCIASPNWLEADGFRQGLWQFCHRPNSQSDYNCEDNGSRDFGSSKAWIDACAALCIIAMIVIFLGTVLTGVTLILKKAPSTKKSMYMGAYILLFLAVVCLVVALIVFPVMFVEQIQGYRDEFGFEKWYFAWAYGIAWGSGIFTFGAAILLVIDRNNEEALNRKTYYQS